MRWIGDAARFGVSKTSASTTGEWELIGYSSCFVVLLVLDDSG